MSLRTADDPFVEIPPAPDINASLVRIEGRLVELAKLVADGLDRIEQEQRQSLRGPRGVA